MKFITIHTSGLYLDCHLRKGKTTEDYLDRLLALSDSKGLTLHETKGMPRVSSEITAALDYLEEADTNNIEKVRQMKANNFILCFLYEQVDCYSFPEYMSDQDIEESLLEPLTLYPYELSEDDDASQYLYAVEVLYEEAMSLLN